MPLTSGTTLGPYQIDAPLGAGGMGEVYKATDTRLDRTVAIKVLPQHVAADPDLKQRFEREARTVAALNHPYICTLHDIGSQDGIDFLVMEYLDGQTVAQRLEKGALPLDQALQIAIDIADGLDKAHRQGIVHRDLKPANIMLTKAGAKLLDFGLAKLKPPEQAGGLSALPTQPADLTQQGAILGTFQYMAPEQLEGQEADARTDIFAFGTVVYEMVTGRKAFEGKSQASLIAAILDRDPPAMSELQAMSPPTLDLIIKTCLAKNPDDRWQTVGDVGRQLQIVASVPDDAAGVAPSSATAHSGRLGIQVAATAALLAAVVTGLVMWSVMRQPVATPEIVRFRMPGPARELRAVGPGFTVSPDGTRIVYSGLQADGNGTQLYLRTLDQIDATPIPGTAAAADPFFSPDGQWVGFLQTGVVWKLSLLGGTPERVSTVTELYSQAGASWGDDDHIVVGTETSGLLRVSADGGDLVELTTLDASAGEAAHRWPSTIADTPAVLFAIAHDRGPGIGTSTSPTQLAVVSTETGEVTKLGLDGTSPRYISTGHILYVGAEDRTLRAAPFDPNRLVVTGPPVNLTQRVAVSSTGAASVGVSGNGRLVYVSGPAGQVGRWRLVWADRTGRMIEPVVDGLTHPWPRLSPDGRSVAASVDGYIWIYDLPRGYSTRVTETGSDNITPGWTPDGAAVVFSSNRTSDPDLYSRPVDLSSPSTLVLDEPVLLMSPSWSPDGEHLLYYRIDPDRQRDLWILSDGGDPTPYLRTNFNEVSPRFSPDGHWVAYASDQSGESRIYVSSFPDGDRTIPISAGPGTQAVWSQSGRELFYRNGTQMLAVEIQLEPEFTVGDATVLFDEPYVVDPADSGAHTYDVSPDGEQFLMLQNSVTAATEFTVVLNWFEELKARVPTN